MGVRRSEMGDVLGAVDFMHAIPVTSQANQLNAVKCTPPASASDRCSVSCTLAKTCSWKTLAIQSYTVVAVRLPTASVHLNAFPRDIDLHFLARH
jgi:hypothetical protein